MVSDPLRLLPLFSSILISLIASFGLNAQIQFGNSQPKNEPIPGSNLTPLSPAVQPQDDIKKLSFQELVSRIQQNDAKINHLFSSIPIGFPEAQKKFMDNISELREKNKVLKEELSASAVRSYVADPDGNPEAAQIVFAKILSKLDSTEAAVGFDPDGALELASVMLEADAKKADTQSGITWNQIAYQAFRAAFALQDFDQAENLIKQIESTGVELIPGIQERLAETRENWEREIMIRRLESNTNDLPQVRIETSTGPILIELFENHAPQTVANFITLVEKGYYDNHEFFFVRPGDYAQVGCVNGDGTSDAGYQIPCECDREQIRHHFAGTVSMVNRGKDTGSAQFFISYQPKPEYDGKFTAFGRIIEGLDSVYKFRKFEPALRGSGIESTRLLTAKVIRKREHDYSPTRVAKNNDSKRGSSPRGSESSGNSTVDK